MDGHAELLGAFVQHVVQMSPVRHVIWRAVPLHALRVQPGTSDDGAVLPPSPQQRAGDHGSTLQRGFEAPRMENACRVWRDLDAGSDLWCCQSVGLSLQRLPSYLAQGRRLFVHDDIVSGLLQGNCIRQSSHAGADDGDLKLDRALPR